MKSLFEPGAAASLVSRLESIPHDRPAKFGTLTAPRMICHLRDSFRAALGEVPVKPKNTPMKNPVMRWLVIDSPIPWPRGAPTAPEFLATKPADWDADRADARALVERLAARGAAADWPEHPAFGRMPGAQWGRLLYRHTDHHLRQFGV